MRPRDLSALDFPRLCARLADFAVSATGKEACLGLRPTDDRAAADRALEEAWQCFRLTERHGDPPLAAFPDIRGHLRRAAHEGFVLDGRALLDVRAVLGAGRAVAAYLRRHLASAPVLDRLPPRLPLLPEVEDSLARSLDEEGNVQDQASDELAAVRARIRQLRETLTRRLEDLVGRRSMADNLSDQYVTIRNNRFVIPVRAGAAGQVSGVVQDRSVSGETFFVEPLFAVDLNNSLLLAVKEEEAIVQRILADLTALVRAEAATVEEMLAALTEFDALAARAGFTRAYRCARPAFSDGEVRLRAARHPGLLFTGRPVTPIDIDLPADRPVLIVTGPNTGGKTVALKTFGLCALMAQSGVPIPAAEGARLPFFSAIFADVGDEQSIERSLSTFSAHVANLCEILDAGSPAPLVLLDEPGVGTDPEDGAALAIGLIRRLEAVGARIAVSTHYTPVKLFALGWERCVVAAVDFDVEALQPHYRLVYHSAGRSLALPIAARLGLPPAVLEAARAAQSEASQRFATALEKLEASRGALERELREANEKLAALAAQEAESRRLLSELRERRRSAWQDELRSARAFVRELKAQGREALEAVREGRQGRAALEELARRQEEAIAAEESRTAEAPAAAPFLGNPGVGDTVEVGERGLRGELLAVEGERAWIQRGSMRFEVPRAQVRAVARAAAERVQVRVETGDESVGGEISLIGLRAREALDRLQDFLDRAVRAGRPSVRIIHGLGSGALRRAVQDYLSASPYCAGFRPGESNEGGNGVTVAELDV